MQLDSLSGTYMDLVMSSIKWCLNHDYDTVREVVAPFIRNTILAMKEFQKALKRLEE